MKARMSLMIFCLFGMALFVYSQSADELVAQADEMLESLNNMDTAKRDPGHLRKKPRKQRKTNMKSIGKCRKSYI